MGRFALHRTSMRNKISKALGLAAFALAVVTQSSWLTGGGLEHGLAWVGLLLVTGGIFGRLWATVYIGGRKNQDLVQEGPFAITRNPLYLFSFLATVGLGLASANPAVMGLIVVAFALYYPGVLSQEEAKLERKHGEAFAAYQAAVPRFWPRLRRDRQEPEWITISVHQFRRSLKDGFGFMVGFVILRVLATAHAQDWLPAWTLL